MNDAQEQRRSFRITEHVHLICERISDREFHEGLERRKLRRGVNEGLQPLLLDLEARLSEKLYLLQAESKSIADCLALLNQKLSAVIEQLPELRKSKTALARKKPQLCELSADGLRFGTDCRFEPGTHLALRFLLIPGNRYIETFSSVLRETSPPDAGDTRHPFGVAVEFLGMPPSHKEVIIQHLFNRESETLRSRRRALAADGGREETGT